MNQASQELGAQLARIEAKLDYVVARQRWTEELLEEMTPIARLAMGSAAERLAYWDDKGAFAMLGQAGAAFEAVLDAYTPDDAAQLVDTLGAILATVRNVTQPDVLAVANDATDVLHHADDVEPVGMIGAVRRASKDEEVRRGLAVALEILRQLGRARGGESPARIEAPAKTEREAPAKTGAAAAPTGGASAAPASCATGPAPVPEETVEWEGHTFYGDGFLVDSARWTPELAVKIAAGLGVTLTDEHLGVVEWVRADYAETGASPNVRRVARGSGVGTEAMYRLFPRTPGKHCAMIAGVPKPVGCV